MESTNVEVKVPTWRELNSRKDPSDTFDDVIRDSLGLPRLEDEDEPAADAVSAAEESVQAVRQQAEKLDQE